MPIWVPDELRLDVPAVLRGQGADPEIVLKRRPALGDVAERALELAQPLLAPQSLYRWEEVKEFRHQQIVLADGHKLSGELIAAHLAQAEKVLLLLCTVGGALEDYSTQLATEDMVLSLAVDGVGSAAVEALANAACAAFESQMEREGLKSSIPLSPGMLGWSVSEGQPQIFKALDHSQIGVTLNSSALMHPRKSLSMVMGFGRNMQIAGSSCDFCAMRETCRYRDHYPEA